MLTVTPNASDAIRQLVASSDVDPDAAGIRIAAGEPTEQGTPLELALVERPEPGDEVVGQDEGAVYLAPSVADALGNTVLDAVIKDDQVSFALRDSEPPPAYTPNGDGPA
jgi:Fe-S cluster assembly iron-binding protein IscA